MRKSTICGLVLCACLSSGCASTCRVAPPPVKVPADLLQPAPPPQAFSTCLREIILFGEYRIPISPECSALLRPELTTPQPNSGH